MDLSRPSWWERRSLVAIALLPVSVVFLIAVKLRRVAFRWRWLKSEALPVPVIVVGNLAVGGSGKTPVVIWLVQALRARGFHPGILSRGYGGRFEGTMEVTDASEPEEVGDEPVLLRMRTHCPTWVGKNRVNAGKALLRAYPDVDIIVTDDGLQHLRLQRSAEIVVVDDRIVGNGWPFPSGPMREPISRASNCSAVVANGPLRRHVRHACGSVSVFPMELRASCIYKLSDPDVTRDLASFTGATTRAVAGIGRPERFFATLEQLGLRGFGRTAFPDHHHFMPEDLRADPGVSLVMTEKDAVKCRALSPDDAWVLPVEAQIDIRMLDVLLEHLHGPQTP